MNVDIVIPVYNEEKDLENGVLSLRDFLIKIKFPYEFQIIISDNNSIDKTPEIGRKLEKKYPNVKYLHIPRKGRGIALRTAFMQSNADIVSYMDVDLSTDLTGFPRLIDEIVKGNDICVGSRLLRDSKVKRCLKREFTSRVYNLILKIMFLNRFTDAEVGFKAFKTEKIKKLLPIIEDNIWFFDTEILVRAEKRGYLK